MLVFLAIILAFSSAPLPVASHGYLRWVEVDGKKYPDETGIEPRWGATATFARSQTPIRLVFGDDGYGQGPVSDPFHNPDMACGVGALVAPGEITAPAGSTVTFLWKAQNNRNVSA